MKDIIIVGASGFGKEVLQLLNRINKENTCWSILGFIDDNPKLSGITINNQSVIGGVERLKNFSCCSVVIAVTDPSLKLSLISKINSYGNDFNFPNIIHPNVEMSLALNQIGHGNIITEGCILTSNIKIGNFNVFNTRTGIGHDVAINDYNIMNPNVQISGNVIIGSSNFFGVNSVILQGLKIGKNNHIGACSLVVRNMRNDMKVFGVPARKFKF